MDGGAPHFSIKRKKHKWGARGDGQLTAKQRSALDGLGVEAIG